MKTFVAAAAPSQDTRLPGDFETLLHNVGLRSTRHRIALVRLLPKTAHRRVSAESLYDEAREAGCPVSRDTACRTLRQFEQAGLVSRIMVYGSKKAWFVIANAKCRHLLEQITDRLRPQQGPVLSPRKARRRGAI